MPTELEYMQMATRVYAATEINQIGEFLKTGNCLKETGNLMDSLAFLREPL